MPLGELPIGDVMLAQNAEYFPEIAGCHRNIWPTAQISAAPG
jgi:hypothetical protein